MKKKKSMWLYKHYDEEMKVLYIGITNHLRHHHDGHKSRSKWYNRIFYIEFEELEMPYMKMFEYERDEIKKYRPEFNIKGNPNYKLVYQQQESS
jgi:hypothetical protein